jgi:hypothetical protein
MPAFYFTFGNNMSLKDNYVKIEAANQMEARTVMVQHHGTRWAFDYTEEQFLPQISKYGLTEVPLGTKCTYIN